MRAIKILAYQYKTLCINRFGGVAFAFKVRLLFAKKRVNLCFMARAGSKLLGPLPKTLL